MISENSTFFSNINYQLHDLNPGKETTSTNRPSFWQTFLDLSCLGFHGNMSDFSVDFTKSYARRRPEECHGVTEDGEVGAMDNCHVYTP